MSKNPSEISKAEKKPVQDEGASMTRCFHLMKPVNCFCWHWCFFCILVTFDTNKLYLLWVKVVWTTRKLEILLLHEDSLACKVPSEKNGRKTWNPCNRFCSNTIVFDQQSLHHNSAWLKITGHLPSLKQTILPENRPGPTGQRSYSNHPFSGAFAVSSREGTGISKTNQG